MAKLAFISYSSEDTDKAEELRQLLEANGVDAWMSKTSVAAGEDYARIIPEMINRCDVFILVLSKDSEDSRFVENELKTATSHKKWIIPIRIDSSKTTEAYAWLLASSQIVNATTNYTETAISIARQISQGRATNAVNLRSSGNRDLSDLFPRIERHEDSKQRHLTAEERIRAFSKTMQTARAAISSLTDDELQKLLNLLGSKLRNGTYDDKELQALPWALAISCEAIVRLLDTRLSDAEIEAAIALCLDMAVNLDVITNRSLIVCVASIFKSLSGKKVHVIECDDFHAKREASEAKIVYSYFGLNVGVLERGMPSNFKDSTYESDIAYGSIREFIFDYLNDTTQINPSRRSQRGLHHAIVCNADSLLIDNATAPYVLKSASGQIIRSSTPFGYVGHYNTLSALCDSAKDCNSGFNDYYHLSFVALESDSSAAFETQEEIWINDDGKWQRTCQLALDALAKGRPALINVGSATDAQTLVDMFSRRYVRAYVADGTNPKEDQRLIGLAGQSGRVTISVGTIGYNDVSPLGGDVEWVAKDYAKEHGLDWNTSRNEALRLSKEQCDRDAMHVSANGGLMIIGTSHQFLKRHDDRLMRLAARNAERAEGIFVSSLTSDFTRLGMLNNELVDDLDSCYPERITGYTEIPFIQALRECQDVNRDTSNIMSERKIEIDTILNLQWESVTALCARIENAGNKHVENMSIIEDVCKYKSNASFAAQGPPDWHKLSVWFSGLTNLSLSVPAGIDSEEELTRLLIDKMRTAYRKKLTETDEKEIAQISTYVMPEMVNFHWPDCLASESEHLKAIESYTVPTVDTRQWIEALKNHKALQEQVFNGFLHTVKERYLRAIFNHAGVGRNDPCPCGSGKKFKNCHGREQRWRTS